MTARTKNFSTKSKYGTFGVLNVFGFPYLALVFTMKGITQMEALEKGNSVPRKIFQSRLEEIIMKLGKSRWNIVTRKV